MHRTESQLRYTLDIRARLYELKKAAAAQPEWQKVPEKAGSHASALARRCPKRSRLSSWSSCPCANHVLIGPPGLATMFNDTHWHVAPCRLD